MENAIFGQSKLKYAMRVFGIENVTWTDLFLVTGITVSSILASVLTGDTDPVGIVAAVAGVVNVVLVAKGSISNYIFGIVSVSLYAFISFRAGIYGTAALNALYFLPMQFVGWYAWRKRGNGDGGSSAVSGRRMNIRQRLVWSAVTAASVVVAAIVLRQIGGMQPWKDASVTVLQVIAMFLMVKAYMEQWILWIAVNIIYVAIWGVFLSKGEPHAAIMLTMWGFYLLNSFNGLRNWLKM